MTRLHRLRDPRSAGEEDHGALRANPEIAVETSLPTSIRARDVQHEDQLSRAGDQHFC